MFRSWRLAVLASLVAAVTALGPAVPAGAVDYLYYSMPTGNIGKTNIDGTGSATTFFAGDPAGVAANSTNIFWSDPVASAVKKATTSGTGVGTLATLPLGAQLNFPVAIDSTYAYYALDISGSFSIGRVRLDGTGSPDPSFITSPTATVTGLAVDANYVYWSYTGNSSGNIYRFNKSTGVTDTIVTGLAGNNVRGIAITATHVYWLNRTQGSIGRASIDGSGSPNSNFITGVADGQGLAAAGSYLYWTAVSGSPGQFIGRTNIDGSGSPNANFISVPSGAIGVAAETSVAPAPTKYALSVTKAGAGTGTVTSSPAGVDCGATCSAEYDSGTSVTLTAAAGSGSTFGSWGGACSGSAATCTVTMSQAQSVTATFDAVPPTPPSNTFKVSAVSTSGSSIRTRVTVPGAGRISQRGTRSSRSSSARAAAASVCSVSRTASKAGTYTLSCKVNSATRKAQKKGKVRVLLRTTFTPTGGTARTLNRVAILPSLKPKYTG